MVFDPIRKFHAKKPSAEKKPTPFFLTPDGIPKGMYLHFFIYIPFIMGYVLFYYIMTKIT